jgi:ABC-type uncharacterized transport system involved in gliding motility auxiliary subunit
VFKDLFGLLSVIVILVSIVIYFSVQSLVTYASVGLLAGMVCLLIYIAVNFDRLSMFFRRQSTKYGLNLLVTVVVLLVIIGIVEVLSARKNIRYDLTAEKTLTLAPLTKQVLEGLEKDVTVTVFYQRDQVFEFRDLLQQFKEATERFSFQLFNLDQNPGRAKEYGIASYGGMVVEGGGKRRTFQFCTEENVVNGIISVTREEAKVVYFLTVHGEGDFKSLDKRVGFSNVSSSLETEGYVVKNLLLLREEKVPEDASVLIVISPRKELVPDELEAISDYLKRGGRVFFMIDPFILPNLEAYLKGYNILVGNDMVVDKESKLLAGDIFSHVVPIYRKHPITRDFDAATVFPLVSSVTPLDPPQTEKALVETLARTTQESWAETNIESIKEGNVYFQEWEDIRGPVSIAVVAKVQGKKGEEESPETASEGETQPEPPGRMVVCGDSDFASNLYVTVLGNKDFFLNIVHWLAEAEELISIRPKKDETYPFSPLFLTENQKKFIFWFSVVVQPLFILCIGIVIYTRRRLRG